MPSINTLPALLTARGASAQTRHVHLLDSRGEVFESISYAQLLDESIAHAEALVKAGLTSSDTVLADFSDHASHIRLFWACAFAGVPFCPLPPPHPDPARRRVLLEHLHGLFDQPTLIGSLKTINDAQNLVPALHVMVRGDLPVKVELAPGSVYPAKEILPDHTMCYMLTSGSTGNSKAVVLKHSNLLSSIRGKIAHHGSTDQSRFLNWIAFDHVACVSEIHLHALEANATQYHVSPSAVIQRPFRLLEWAAKFDITYTFSPNFLIAQILRDCPPTAVDLSALQVFISGGESVPIGTAIKFADLLEKLGSPRNALRAGFGMSETGAGSIYDTRPIPKAVNEGSGLPLYLSLGKCCPGIAMHVIDIETGAKCLPGTVGHLVVEGETVFSRYHSNIEATRDAFPINKDWFVTGDLAQIDSDGNLFLEGRAKDTLNINGVKYLPVDVATSVEDAQIDGVNVGSVRVCPFRPAQADTETYIVFFEHPIDVSSELDVEQKAMINASRVAIRGICVSFCSQFPYMVLPLPAKALIRTSLGKVSGAQLVQSFVKGEFDDIVRFLDVPSDRRSSDLVSPIDITLASIISSLFSLESTTLRRSDNVFDMGASSMHLMRLKHEIQTHLKLDSLPTMEMLKRPDIGSLSDYLTTLVSSPHASSVIATEYTPMVCFNSSGSKPPLFLIHPGVGEVLVFVNLARVLADDRPVYALRARGFDHGDSAFATFEEMVQCYASEMEICNPSGSFYIAGYSFGGAVAFEVGKLLESRGRHVAFVGVLNLPPHIQFRLKELSWIEVLLNLTMFLSLIPDEAIPQRREEVTKAYPCLKDDSVPDNAKEVIQWLLRRCDQARVRELDLELDPFCRWVAVAYEVNRTGRTFEPSGKVENALLSVFCAIPLHSMGTREEFKRDRLSAWKDFSGPRFEMIDVDGEHYTMIGDAHVASFAAHLRGALARADEPTARIAPMPPVKGAFDEVPIIDFSLADSDPSAYMKQLEYGLETVGFAVFINVPGFEDCFQQECFTLSEQFFTKPESWKEALGTGNSPALRGFFNLNNKASSNAAYAEAFRVGADRPSPGALDDPAVPFWLKLHEGPNQWPEDIPGFKSTLNTLFERYRQLNLQLNKHICQLLSIPNHVLDDFFPVKTEFNSAIWHYLPVTPEIKLAAKNGFAMGMHEHRDPSTFITCLIQNRPGLQVQNHQGQWIDIPLVKGGVVCNVGMQLMKLTGGKLVATTHRVNTLNIEKDRYTIPYVLTTKLEKPVIPLPQFDNPEMAKAHVAPNPKIGKLFEIQDPLMRSGYARLTLFPAATQKLYPVQFEEARQMGLL